MTTFLLIRHGQTDAIGRFIAGRLPGVPLNEEGRKQVRRLAERLAGWSPAACYASPLERTRQTAAALAEAWALPVLTSDAILELDFGEWAGLSMADLDARADWPAFNRFRSTLPMPGGETMLQVQARAVAQLEAWRHQHEGQVVAVVSHGDVIRAVLAHFLGMPLDLLTRFDIAPASWSVVELAEWGPLVKALNQDGV